MARKKKKRNASRGSVNNIILRTLASGDKYGYEIIKEVENFSDGKIVLKQPSLYSSLTRFEEKKYVSSYWGDSDIGGRRHYYHLTDEGYQYYKKFVLKESSDDDDDNVDENTLEKDTVDIENNLITQTNNSNQNETAESDNNQELDMVINEINENEIPEFAKFDIKDTESVVIISDHQFHNSTPLESMVNDTSVQEKTTVTREFVDNSTSIKQDSLNNEIINNPKEDDINNRNIIFKEIVYSLRDISKQSYKKYIENNNRRLYLKKPKRVQKIILDSDGIYKLRDEDYVPPKRQKEIIVDNVVKRSSHTSDIYGYASYTEKTQSNKSSQPKEITEEEKRQRNENFIAKFDLLTMSKIKPVTAPVQKTEPVKEVKPEPQIDYRSKLNAIIDKNNLIEKEPIIEQNNLFNYVNEDKWLEDNNTTSSRSISNIIEQENNDNITLDNDDLIDDDSYINFDEETTFETKDTSEEYIKEINTYTAPPTQVNMTRYDNITQAVLVDKTYLLNNKLKMVFGIIMSLFMVAEITTLLLIFKNTDLYQVNDKIIFILAYVFVGIFALICILPYFVNSNSHKQNNFKLKYSIWFGILTFLVGSILIYCINALNGFEIDNFEFFAVKLILPMLLIFNFVISPLVYSLLLKNKSFYD